MDRTELREKIEAAIDECRYGDLVAGGYRYDGDKLRDRLMTLFEPLVEVAETVWRAHVPVTGTQHDPARGLLHGYCERCRVPWPCAWSPESGMVAVVAEMAGDNSLTATQRAAKVRAALAQERGPHREGRA